MRIVNTDFGPEFVLNIDEITCVFAYLVMLNTFGVPHDTANINLYNATKGVDLGKLGSMQTAICNPDVFKLESAQSTN